MPMYHFRLRDEPPGETVDLPDDHAAWSELVSLAGAMLKDIDGRLPDQSRLELVVYEGERCVGSIKVFAVKGKKPTRSTW